MKRLLIIPIIILFVSCINDAKQTTQDGNFKIEFLFEKDSCKMYRFQDGGRYIYWCNCEGKINSDYRSGGKTKHTNYNETIINNQ